MIITWITIWPLYITFDIIYLIRNYLYKNEINVITNKESAFSFSFLYIIFDLSSCSLFYSHF